MLRELTSDIVRASPQITNPLHERELSLRSLSLSSLPVTDSELWLRILTNFDTLDISENDIKILDCCPIIVKTAATATSSSSSSKSKANTQNPEIRLTSIIAHKNLISGISRNFATQLSTCLTSLLLHKNSIRTLAECNIFGEFKKLCRLSLLENPVCGEQYYREHVISVCSPTLKLLDFQRVKEKERVAAQEYKKMWKEMNATTTNNAVDNDTVVAVGGGRRAARRAQMMLDQQQNNQVRARDATEKEILGHDAKSVSDVVGHAVLGASSHQKPTHDEDDDATTTTTTTKKMTREEIMSALEQAESIEEMDRLEKLLEDLE